jgi:hypothetical protein
MIEVLRQMTEALEDITRLLQGITGGTFSKLDVAIQEGRQAIAELESQEPVALVIDGVLVKSELPEKYTGHLYTTPPQRIEQEPVIMWPCHIIEADFHERTITLGMECGDYKVSAGTHWLSTHPPQRTWVGLTDEELEHYHHQRWWNAREMVREVEAKLKERNS